MKLIEDIIRENVRQILNEYSTDKHIVELYNLLALNDQERREYIKNYVYEHLYVLGEFILHYPLYRTFENNDNKLSDDEKYSDLIFKIIRNENFEKFILSAERKKKFEPLFKLSKIYNAYKRDGTIIKCDSLIDELKNSQFSYILDDYYKKGFKNISELSFFEYKDPKYIQNQWLIHFSKYNNHKKISKEGFQYSKDLSNLAVSYSNNDETNKKDGYCFAYTFDSYIKSKQSYLALYGEDFVLFQASGIEVTHKRSGDRMTIFWGPSAKNFISVDNKQRFIYDLESVGIFFDKKIGRYYKIDFNGIKHYFNMDDETFKKYIDEKYEGIKLGRVHDWYEIYSIKNNKLLFTTYDQTFKELKQWLDNNFAQYHNSMVNYNTNKRFRDYETNYNR